MSLSAGTRRAPGDLLILVISAILATSSVCQPSVQLNGNVDVFRALYLEERKPDCDSTHADIDFVYFTPKDPTAEQEDAWFEIASGPDVATALNLTTGENVTVTLSNYQQPPATDTNGTRPGTNASATPESSGSGTRRLLQSGLAHGRGGRVLLSNPAPVLEGFEKVGEGESSKEIWAGEPIYVRSSFYIVNFCGFAPSITKEALQRVVYSGFGTPNLEDYHSTCSYNKAFLRAQDNRIYDNIEVPCTGTVQTGILTYNYNSQIGCGAAEQFSWRQFAENRARELGDGPFMDFASRRRIVLILPRQAACGWAGLASVGCGGPTCSVYIQGNSANDLDVIMHELGHTQGLSHSGKGWDEYGDQSDVMGNDGSPAQGYLCTNVCNQFRIGWNIPLANLFQNNTNSAGTNTGIRGRWTLPAAYRTPQNYIVFNYSSWDVPFPNVWVSFRARSAAYDNILRTELNNKVFIHNFNGTQWDRDYNRSMQLAVLTAGQSYRSPFVDQRGSTQAGGGVQVRVAAIAPGMEATVDVCFFNTQTEAGNMCFDGIDNDCNGLTDECDPSCGMLSRCTAGRALPPPPLRFQSPSPPPPPRLPPTPPPSPRPPPFSLVIQC